MSNETKERQAEQQSVETLIIGEVLFDCFPDGTKVLGGASFNVAWGLRGLGREAALLSAVGKDDAGDQVISSMEAWRLPTDEVSQLEHYPTGRVDVSFVDGEPNYTIVENVAWDHLLDSGIIANRLIYHGSLALRSAHNNKVLQSIVDRSPDARRFFDVNLRTPYDDHSIIERWLEGADWVKLNIDEFCRLSGEEGISFDDPVLALKTFADRFSARNILLTAGQEGACIYTPNELYRVRPAAAADPFVDSVGAGDGFTAFTIHALLSEWPLETAIQQASRFAAKVCSLRGATTSDHNFYDLSNG